MFIGSVDLVRVLPSVLFSLREACPENEAGVDVPDALGDAVLPPHPLEDDSKDTVHVEVDNSIDHDHPAADVVVEVEFDSDNNPLQLRPREVYHVVVDRDVDCYHQQPETRRVVVEVDNFVVGYYTPVAGYCTLVVWGIADVVVVAGGLVDFHRRVISGESGRFGSSTPCWAAIFYGVICVYSRDLTAGSSSPTEVMV